MDLLILLVVIGVVIAFVVTRSQRREKQRELEALAAVRAAAEEDVVRYGEDVTLLGNETAGRDMDEATRQDYRRALDAYDASKSALDRVTKPDDIRGITGILEDGRYAIACVQARLAGKPVPARLPPCFFNPQHGPSVENVEWAPPGGVPRSVPACAADAERVRAGAEPDVRKVPVGAGRAPYWQGGRGYGPYAQGYFSPFATSGLLPGLFLGSLLSGGFGGGDGSYSDGYQDGQDAGDGSGSGDGGDGSGGGDGGGGDGGGGDGGGYDSASGDGGGGSDFGGGGDWGGGGGGDWGGGGGDFGGGDFG
jgi:type II secretory pathway pseudopilin PulG